MTGNEIKIMQNGSKKEKNSIIDVLPLILMTNLMFDV